jgi:hypothetical protein
MQNHPEVIDWIGTLRNHRNLIGLKDLGETQRTSWWHFFRPQGMQKLKEKNRYTKNLSSEGAKDTLSIEQIHAWLAQPDMPLTTARARLNILPNQEKDELNQWIRNEFFRRTSKLGIDFILGLGSRIHFNLAASMDSARLPNEADGIRKLNRMSGKTKYKRNITVSEYRHAMKVILGNAALRNRFNFYNDF